MTFPDPSKIVLVLVGAFYIFAGYVGVRAALSSRLMDKAISGITLRKPPAIETAKFRWLVTISIVVGLGGLALVVLSRAALPLFGLGAAVQAFYIFVAAPLWMDKRDHPGEQGRRGTRNAFVIYLFATAFVAWADVAGQLTPLSGTEPVQGAVAGVIALALAVDLGRQAWAVFRR